MEKLDQKLMKPRMPKQVQKAWEPTPLFTQDPLPKAPKRQRNFNQMRTETLGKKCSSVPHFMKPLESRDQSKPMIERGNWKKKDELIDQSNIKKDPVDDINFCISIPLKGGQV